MNFAVGDYANGSGSRVQGERESERGVDDDGDGALAVLMAAAGGRVLLLVITTFVASTARGAGRALRCEGSSLSRAQG